MINKKYIIEKTGEFVKEQMEGDCTGHDFWHIERVKKISLHIGRIEGGDLFIIELSALLHDIGDYKFHKGDEQKGSEITKKFLKKFSLDENPIEHICKIIDHLSFKGALVENKIDTIEGKIVQDADRLDAMGAIGIARTFAYGGYKGQEIYNPLLKPRKHETFEDYKKSKTTTINHFYEKLLLLKNLMNTETGKLMAEKRQEFMELFLKNFYEEWEGNYS